MIRRGGRRTSNVFAAFSQRQIAELKEAFAFMDQNGDGEIDRRDLAELLSSLGHRQTEIPAEVEALMAAAVPPGAEGKLTFPLFVAMLGDRVQGADERDTIISAFDVLDRQRCGRISASDLRAHLAGAFSDAEFDALIGIVGMDAAGRVDYRRLADLMVSPLDSDELQ